MKEFKITIRLNYSEKELIERRALKARKDLSSYCREILIDSENRLLTI